MTTASGAPSVAVVVATHERSALLPRLVRALEAQEGAPPFEVVVVDDGSTDDTWGELTALARTVGVPLMPLRMGRNRGPAAARNAGWRATSATVIAFTDDDCVPDPGWLAPLVAELDRADLVQGRTVPDPAQLHRSGPFSRTLQVEQEDGFYQTCNIAYRRSWLERLGGFDEDFRHPAGEDTELAWRAVEAGARTAFVGDALVHHDVRPSSLLVALADTRRWGSVVLAVRKHPALRRRLHSRWFWRASHPRALSAVTGLGLAVAVPRAAVPAALLALPYLVHRLHTTPLPTLGVRRRLVLLPAALLLDTLEVGVCAAASVRYRRLVL